MFLIHAGVPTGIDAARAIAHNKVKVAASQLCEVGSGEGCPHSEI